MKIKYEAVFGPQHLFKLPSTEIIVVGPHGDKTESNIDLMIGNTPDDYVIVAMRRIIHEPKRWTMEDQKAGKFPEVGSMLNNKTRGECTFIGFGDDDKTYWALKLKNDLIYIADKNWCTPIETTEEKAARLREEWCNEAGLVCSLGMTTLTRIYDALLSGELPMPGKE